ncbi:MAG TPA: DUF3631 domain-containing protein [Mycobacteriales bacterium]|nr:DUF3631 domain-containing protein [Mycobacteriales bacterium]
MSADLLDDVEAFVTRFVAYPSEAAVVAVVLWCAHAHLLDSFESTPRLAHLSPEPGSGKSRSLEVIELLVPRPVLAVNVTPAYLFRKVGGDEGRATVLFDEIDTVFGPKAKDNEDIRGLLNAGHRRGATAGRCVVRGKTVETEELPAYAAVAIAGLGDSLPDTIMTRSVVVRMRRRAPHERVEPFRHRLHAPEGHALRDRLERWASEVRAEVTEAWPQIPPGVEDRNADVWEPLLAVADAAGGHWPVRARVAAVTFVTQSADRAWTLGVRLLDDLRTIFDSENVDGLHTQTLLDRLCELEEAPWGDLRGRPLDARGLARRLKAYDVEPKPVRIGDVVLRGYRREDLADAWSRYLPAPPTGGVTTVTAATAIECLRCGRGLLTDDVRTRGICAACRVDLEAAS